KVKNHGPGTCAGGVTACRTRKRRRCSVLVVIIQVWRRDPALLGDLLAQPQLLHLGLEAAARDPQLARRAGHVGVGLRESLADQGLLDAARAGLDGLLE